MIILMGITLWLLIGFCVMTVWYALFQDVKVEDLVPIIALSAFWPFFLLAGVFEVVMKRYGDRTIISKIENDTSTKVNRSDHGPPH